MDTAVSRRAVADIAAYDSLHILTFVYNVTRPEGRVAGISIEQSFNSAACDLVTANYVFPIGHMSLLRKHTRRNAQHTSFSFKEWAMSTKATFRIWSATGEAVAS